MNLFVPFYAERPLKQELRLFQMFRDTEEGQVPERLLSAVKNQHAHVSGTHVAHALAADRVDVGQHPGLAVRRVVVGTRHEPPQRDLVSVVVMETRLDRY